VAVSLVVAMAVVALSVAVVVPVVLRRERRS
jgi:hypothetical protein